jgi:serine/threonine protein phosphatase PrpC
MCRKPDIFGVKIWTSPTGEDAEPILHLITEQNSETGLLGVCDGLGGAGGTKYTQEDGTVYTGAYIASRRVREIVKQHFDTLLENNPPLTEKVPCNTLKRALVTGLQETFEKLDAPPSRIKSTMIQRLPTTTAKV